MKHKILVLGATGNVGGHLMQKLIKDGRAVKAASRTGELDFAGAEGVLFDLEDPTTYASALEGVVSAYVLVPVGHENAYDLMMPFLQALVERKIKIVFLSGMGVEAYKQSDQRDIEDWLKTSGANFVILRPNWFMDNFHTFWRDNIVDNGMITVPAADHKISFIDARDIAGVAAKVLSKEKWDRQTLVLTGPNSLYYHQATKILSARLGRSVAPAVIPLVDYVASLKSIGLPEAYADRFGAFYEVAINGFNEKVTGTVEAVTGCKARSFNEYATHYFG